MPVYKCINKKCEKYREEFTSVAPAEQRKLTGRSVSCDKCGDVAFYVRPDPVPNVEPIKK